MERKTDAKSLKKKKAKFLGQCRRYTSDTYTHTHTNTHIHTHLFTSFLWFIGKKFIYATCPKRPPKPPHFAVARLKFKCQRCQHNEERVGERKRGREREGDSQKESKQVGENTTQIMKWNICSAATAVISISIRNWTLTLLALHVAWQSVQPFLLSVHVIMS